MDAAVEASFLNRSSLVTLPKTPQFHTLQALKYSPPPRIRILSLRPPTISSSTLPLPFPGNSRALVTSRIQSNNLGPFSGSLIGRLRCEGKAVEYSSAEVVGKSVNLRLMEVLLRRGLVLAVMIFGIMVAGCWKALAVEGILNAGTSGTVLKGSWPKVLQVLMVLREQGLVLAGLLGLSAFFSMAETSITTLWPWKVRELAEKESEDGVFKMLRSDVTRFLTTILIGTTVVNIGATALVTEAATAIFGEAGVSAATGVMTVVILLLTEITPKSIAVHNATDVARFVVRPVALLSHILYPVGRVVTYLSMGMLKLLGLKDRSEPNVTEDELKLMLRGAELSGAIEEEEQDMIENVLEIKDTHVREVMTPLVDVVAIDASATLVDFHDLWVTHQYSRVPVFEQRIDNIVGIAYAMDLLDYVQKGDLLESSVVGDMAHKPAYFVPGNLTGNDYPLYVFVVVVWPIVLLFFSWFLFVMFTTLSVYSSSVITIKRNYP